MNDIYSSICQTFMLCTLSIWLRIVCSILDGFKLQESFTNRSGDLTVHMQSNITSMAADLGKHSPDICLRWHCCYGISKEQLQSAQSNVYPVNTYMDHRIALPCPHIVKLQCRVFLAHLCRGIFLCALIFTMFWYIFRTQKISSIGHYSEYGTYILILLHQRLHEQGVIRSTMVYGSIYKFIVTIAMGCYFHKGMARRKSHNRLQLLRQITR